MAAPRVLLSGDVRGRLDVLFKRVNSVSISTGPFNFLLCVGQFFPTDPDRLDEFMEFVEGRKEIPLPTYFIGDYGIGAAKVLARVSSENSGFKMDGLRVCENLYWLKGSGKFVLNGLCIAYLSGRCTSDGQPFGVYSEDDVDALRALAEDSGAIDLFLTNEWPEGINQGADTSQVSTDIFNSSGNDPTISKLVSELAPRYHVAGTKGVYFAREPYTNDAAVNVTRFLGLADVGNNSKEKFIHAISPTPACMMTPADFRARPASTTISPYTTVEKPNNDRKVKKALDEEEQPWRYDTSKKRHKHNNFDGKRYCFSFISAGSCSRGENCDFLHDMEARKQFTKGCCFDFIVKGKCERGQECKYLHSSDGSETSSAHKNRSGAGADNMMVGESKRGQPKQCWFCLSNPNVESHLIISIGETFYCALAKGPLVKDHVLLIPVEHSPNTLSVLQDAEIELLKFKSALKAYFRAQGKAIIVYEWLPKPSKSSHTNLQVVPVPLHIASDARKQFVLAAKRLGFEFCVTEPKVSDHDARTELRSAYDPRSNFFYAELAEGTILYYNIEDEGKFLAQFGREVLADLLNEKDRANWRNCVLSKEEDGQMAENFKEKFKQFDPFQ